MFNVNVLITQHPLYLSRNAAVGHLVSVLLNAQLLELGEFGSPVFESQPAARLVLGTFFGRAVGERFERRTADWLKNLRPASVASVGRYLQLRLK